VEAEVMTAHDKCQLLSMIGCNDHLLGAAVVVIEEWSPPRVVRAPHAPGPKSYVTLYQLDPTNDGWSGPTWRRNLQLQLVKLGAPVTDVAFASAVGGEYACFLSVAQDSSACRDHRWLELATKAMQDMQMSFNLQYLQVQSQMQNENRSYTALSNIMKTKHDTVKNSISNVR
jgi:hypothetical protein